MRASRRRRVRRTGSAPEDWPPPGSLSPEECDEANRSRCARRKSRDRRAIGSDAAGGATGLTAVPLPAVGELTVVELEKLGLPATVAVSDLDNVAGPVDGVFEFTKRWEEGS